MNFDFLPQFGAFFSPTMVAILVPIAAIALGGVIAVCGMYFHHQQKRLLHDTARLALEKGQPLPPELIAELSDAGHVNAAHRNQPRNDIRVGLILIAVGVGLYLFFGAMSLQSLRFAGAIPGLIGVALLLYGVFASVFSGKDSSSGDRSTQA